MFTLKDLRSLHYGLRLGGFLLFTMVILIFLSMLKVPRYL